MDKCDFGKCPATSGSVVPGVQVGLLDLADQPGPPRRVQHDRARHPEAGVYIVPYRGGGEARATEVTFCFLCILSYFISFLYIFILAFSLHYGARIHSLLYRWAIKKKSPKSENTKKSLSFDA